MRFLFFYSLFLLNNLNGEQRTASWLRDGAVSYLVKPEIRENSAKIDAQEFEIWTDGFLDGIASLRWESNSERRANLWTPKWGDNDRRELAKGLALYISLFQIPDDASARLTILSWWLFFHPDSTQADKTRAAEIIENIGGSVSKASSDK